MRAAGLLEKCKQKEKPRMSGFAPRQMLNERQGELHWTAIHYIYQTHTYYCIILYILSTCIHTCMYSNTLSSVIRQYLSFDSVIFKLWQLSTGSAIAKYFLSRKGNWFYQRQSGILGTNVFILNKQDII